MRDPCYQWLHIKSLSSFVEPVDTCTLLCPYPSRTIPRPPSRYNKARKWDFCVRLGTITCDSSLPPMGWHLNSFIWLLWSFRMWPNSINPNLCPLNIPFSVCPPLSPWHRVLILRIRRVLHPVKLFSSQEYFLQNLQ